MITFILNVIYSFVSYIIGLFPTGTGFPDTWHTAFQTLGDYLHLFDPLVPIGILLECLTAIVLAEIGVWGFKTFKWIISHIPFFGGKG